MKVAHLSIPGLANYLHVSKIQERLVRRLLDYRSAPFDHIRQPTPVIVTAEFNPVYTCGRREVSSFTPSLISYLQREGRAEFHEALRGGQTTYHGPGQLTAYPILDLKSFRLSPRDYICHLETAVINTCQSFGVKGFRTENPGVWVSQDQKICAVGVHLRRYISSHGIGLNVTNEVSEWFDRIVACGLEGKSATNLEVESREKPDVEIVGRTFVKELATVLGAKELVTIKADELEELLL